MIITVKRNDGDETSFNTSKINSVTKYSTGSLCIALDNDDQISVREKDNIIFDKDGMVTIDKFVDKFKNEKY